MFFILSKTVALLFKPLSLVVDLFLVAIIVKGKLWRRRLMVAGIASLLFFSNEFLANETMMAWENPPMPFSTITTPYEVGIVLTGVTAGRPLTDDRVYFVRGADRILHAIQLYKAGKIKKILLTGGIASISGKTSIEAESLAKVAIMAGIPANSLIIENQARNTYENAIYSAAILDSLALNNTKNLLITSAFHMPRASACFSKAQVPHDTFGCDFFTTPRRIGFRQLFVPSIGALQKWSILMKEWLGLVAYKAAGYI